MHRDQTRPCNNNRSAAIGTDKEYRQNETDQALSSTKGMSNHSMLTGKASMPASVAPTDYIHWEATVIHLHVNRRTAQKRGNNA